jgi:DNA-binding response OmpR family regulator
MKEVLQHYSILYAEDNKALQQSTSEYLQRYLRTLYIASDGREALNLYRRHSPDVIMLDIDMPHVDGLEVAKQIRTVNKEIPILMFTAFTDVDKLLKATELNLCKYLVKPVKPFEFKEALSKLSQTLEENHSHYTRLKEGYIWDSSKEVLLVNDNLVELSQKEQTLLALLVKHHQESVSFESIMAVVWEDEFDTEISIQSVKFQVTLLRKKLPKDSIQNVYGKGYILH